jgi:hypothetical protein
MKKEQKTMFFLFGIIVCTIGMCLSGVAMTEHPLAMIWFFVSIFGIAANFIVIYLMVFPTVKIRKYKMVNQDDANIQDEIGEHGSFEDAACEALDQLRWMICEVKDE